VYLCTTNFKAINIFQKKKKKRERRLQKHTTYFVLGKCQVCHFFRKRQQNNWQNYCSHVHRILARLFKELGTLILNNQHFFNTRFTQSLLAFTYIFHCYSLTSKLTNNFKRFITHCTTFQHTNLCTPLKKKFQTRPTAHPACYSIATVFLSRGLDGRDVKLATHLHLVRR